MPKPNFQKRYLLELVSELHCRSETGIPGRVRFSCWSSSVHVISLNISYLIVRNVIWFFFMITIIIKYKIHFWSTISMVQWRSKVSLERGLQAWLLGKSYCSVLRSAGVKNYGTTPSHSLFRWVKFLSCWSGLDAASGRHIHRVLAVHAGETVFSVWRCKPYHWFIFILLEYDFCRSIGFVHLCCPFLLHSAGIVFTVPNHLKQQMASDWHTNSVLLPAFGAVSYVIQMSWFSFSLE